MHWRFRIILPAIGLLLFTTQTYTEYRHWQTEKATRYFWWSFLRLDSDPLNHPYPTKKSDTAEPGEASWELRDRWVDPGYVVWLLLYSGLPAFVVSLIIVGVLGHLGISQILSFMILMPVMLGTWYYSVGWLLDRWVQKKRMASK